jgi:hypothetical protein
VGGISCSYRLFFVLLLTLTSLLISALFHFVVVLFWVVDLSSLAHFQTHRLLLSLFVVHLSARFGDEFGNVVTWCLFGSASQKGHS